jgi:hypothetical protein
MIKRGLFLFFIFSLLILSSCNSPAKEECSQDTYDCNEFKTHQEAQKLYELCGGVENDIHWLDGNKDGDACESLPSMSGLIKIIFIISFVLILIIAFLLFRKHKKKDKNKYKKSENTNNNNEDFSNENVEKGEKFAKYIANNLKKKGWYLEHFSVHVNGIGAIGTYKNPDIEARHMNTNKIIAFECKYRHFFQSDKYGEKAIKIDDKDEKHLNNYKKYRTKKGYPVFIFIGTGEPNNPDKIFLLPLDEVDWFMLESNLKNYSFDFSKDFDLKDILR